MSSAKGDAVIADCLKELRMLFKDVVVHLPKVVVTLQLTGITVTDERSKVELYYVYVRAFCSGFSYCKFLKLISFSFNELMKTCRCLCN